MVILTISLFSTIYLYFPLAPFKEFDFHQLYYGICTYGFLDVAYQLGKFLAIISSTIASSPFSLYSYLRYHFTFL